jgi:hypothetical protein
MFCAIYDELGAPPALMQFASIFSARVNASVQRTHNAQAQTDQYLAIMLYRYTMYLDLLVSEGNSPKEKWPLPPWYVPVPHMAN